MSVWVVDEDDENSDAEEAVWPATVLGNPVVGQRKVLDQYVLQFGEPAVLYTYHRDQKISSLQEANGELLSRAVVG